MSRKGQFSMCSNFIIKNNIDEGQAFLIKLIKKNYYSIDF